MIRLGDSRIRPALILVLSGALSVVIAACGQAPPGSEAIGIAIAQTQEESSAEQVAEPQVALATNTPQPSPTPLPPTSMPAPEVQPSVDVLWSKNYVGANDNGGVTIEIARVLVGNKNALPDFAWDELNESIEGWAETEVVGELIFIVTNNTDKTVSVFPDQGTVQIGNEQIDLTDFFFYTTFGDDVGGDIFPGVTKIGGIWFGIGRSTPADVTQIIYRTSGPFNSDTFDDLGPDYEIVIDIPDHVYEEVPEELN